MNFALMFWNNKKKLLKICELFDLVVGVSTGSIIASLLCVKGMGASEAKKLYEETAGKLFRTAMLSRFR